MIPFRSVNFRLTLWYAFILATFLSLFGFLMHTELARALYRDLDFNLRNETNVIRQAMLEELQKKPRAVPLNGAVPFSFAHAAQPEVREALYKFLREWEKNNHRVSRSTVMVRMIAFDRSLLLSNLTGWEKEILFPDFERDSVFMESGSSYQTIHFEKYPMRLYYQLVRFNNIPVFIIQTAQSMHAIESTLNRLAFIILLSIPGGVAAACIAGWFLVKRSFSPIDSMIREARQITAAYLKGRLPRTGTGDEVDRLAETLNEMMGRIEVSTRAVQDFSSDISHELRTPLAIIRGEIDLAMRRERSKEDLINTLKVIEGEVNELIRLVDDLILLVRSDAKQLKFEKHPFLLAALLNQVVSRYKERAEQKSIHLSAETAVEAQIMGDEVYVKRLVSNLVDNAIKFTPAGGSVGVKLGIENNFAAVEVKDNGIGIEIEMQEKVFSRFYRTDSARAHEGAGLGLNIARAICESHGGRIRMTSTPGKGTQITVLLPLYNSNLQ